MRDIRSVNAYQSTRYVHNGLPYTLDMRRLIRRARIADSSTQRRGNKYLCLQFYGSAMHRPSSIFRPVRYRHCNDDSQSRLWDRFSSLDKISSSTDNGHATAALLWALSEAACPFEYPSVCLMPQLSQSSADAEMGDRFATGRSLQTQVALPASVNCEPYLGAVVPFPWGSWIPI